MKFLSTSDNAFGNEAAMPHLLEQAAPRETSDPVEILMRKEIEIGITLRGVPLDRKTRLELAFSLNIVID